MEPPNIEKVNVYGSNYQRYNSALNLETVEALLYVGGDVVCSDIHGCSPVYYACAGGNIEVLRALMSRGVDINADCTADKRKPLHIAAKYGYPKIIKYLLESKAKVTAVDANGATALHEVYSRRVAKLLLQYGSDLREVDNLGMTALHWACERGILPVVRILVRRGATIDKTCAQMFTPLHYAVIQNKEEIVRFLLENKANVNIKTNFGATPLYLAFEHPHKGIIEMLLAHGADFNDMDKRGKTALHKMCITGCASVMEMLLEKGADINSRCKDLMTPLHYAAQEGNYEKMKLLLERGADVNCKDKYGLTPFHVACYVGQEKSVDILLKYGVNVNSVSSDNTGLHLASKQGYASVVKMLVENGADINTVCSKGKTALSYARSYYLDSRNEWIDYNSCCEILEREIIKLRCLNYYVCDENIRLINSNLVLKDFISSCENEIFKLKTHIVHNKISFYDFLSKDENKLAIYTKNRNILRAIEECEIRGIYPIYSDMIEENVKKGQKRLTLLKEGENCLKELLNYELPVPFTSGVLTYLGNEDVCNLIASCQPRNELI